ncbi:MAG: thiamine pyrophosphate-binding protein [Chloroflexi bacterium]|jgi:acetolactate synthase I/II/III large subunit|nr:thiamine pyrophosphate-binding protein [Chloroflexota bacterium]
MPRLSGAQMIAEFLVKAGVRHVAGIPGHGIWTVLDAFLDYPDLNVIQVLHEQSAAHLADGYYRASGKPIAAFASIGPGAANTVVGVATAYVDSQAMMLLTGSPHTYMRGHSVLQELDRAQWANFPRVTEGITKQVWQPSRVEQLPFVMQRAWSAMTTGRPGPVHLDLPMDVQADDADVVVHGPEQFISGGRPRPDAHEVQRAARLLAGASRPVIVAGGGTILSEASPELVALAEHLGIPVVTTWMGKGSIPEDHPLNGWSIGDTASTSGNTLAANADVVLSVGCRFVDWSASSYRAGVSFTIPPSALIQIDLEPREIGKNYPVTVGLVADAKAALADLLAAVGDITGPRDWRNGSYFGEIVRLKAEWDAICAVKRESDQVPMTQSRAIKELRAALDRRAIVVTGAGIVQAVVRQEFPVYEPRTHLTSGGYSTMGFTVPAAIGAKLAQPDRQVAAVCGDGDFLQTMQEIGVAAMLDLPVLFVVLNNSGFGSIKGGQLANFGRTAAVDFMRRGQPYTPHYANVAREFGIPGEQVTEPSQVAPAIRRALASGGPALVEVIVARDFPDAGANKTGWWDVPVPYTRGAGREAYLAGKAEEQI